MNHPTREEWMSYLYDETSGDRHAALTAHLGACAECTSRVGSWREVAADLDAWKLSARPNRRLRIPAVARWAAAAAIVLSFGYVAGRSSVPAGVSIEQVRAAIEPSLRQQMQQEIAQTLRTELAKSSDATLATAGVQTRGMIEAFSKVSEQNRASDSRAVFAALNKLEAQRLADYAELKRDLDTVAVYSEAGYRQTQRQLVQLASYTEPETGPSSLPQN